MFVVENLDVYDIAIRLYIITSITNNMFMYKMFVYISEQLTLMLDESYLSNATWLSTDFLQY